MSNREKTSGSILLVTDNAPMAASMRESLGKRNYSVEICPGGRRVVRDVIDALGEQDFDIVIMDIVFLIYAGRGTIREIKRADEHVDLILIAGHGSMTLAVDYLKEGVSDFISRPVNIDHLEIILKRVMERRNLLREARERARSSPESPVDGLTGLFTRSYFRARVEQEISESRRKNRDLSILFLEVDDLKNINDEYGRKAGDDVLKIISASVRKICRDYDIVARSRDYEFAIILPDATREMARLIADRILGEISGGSYRGIADRTVTASIGISSFPCHAESPEELLKGADAALVISRTNGKNRYTLFHKNPEVTGA